MLANNLQTWLHRLMQLHPSEIELGLDRVRQVWQQHGLHICVPVITVAGTNGKGSSIAMLAAIYKAAGFRVACYTSPHIIDFNERICINDVCASDDEICSALDRIEHSRNDISLTYFEFTTLAALDIFCCADIDLIILEVGLGGRLDAVNIVDPDVALITTIAMDHIDWLGDNLETIGREKAGILRRNGQAVLADPEMPASVVEMAEQLQVDYHLAGQQYQFAELSDGWTYQQTGQPDVVYLKPALAGSWQIQNAAAVVSVIKLLADQLPVTKAAIDTGLRHMQLLGRFQQLADAPDIYVDVSHNEQALLSLRQNIRSVDQGGKIFAIFSMLADKDIEASVAVMRSVVDHWFVCGINESRGQSAKQIADVMPGDLPVTMFDSVALAMRQASTMADEQDTIIAFGSFYVVAEAIEACRNG